MKISPISTRTFPQLSTKTRLIFPLIEILWSLRTSQKFALEKFEGAFLQKIHELREFFRGWYLLKVYGSPLICDMD